MRTLGIISHTEHYLDNGKIVGWGPTIQEINYLSGYFDKIIHLAVLLEDELPPKSTLSYASDKIEFRSLPITGGKRILQKINILFKAPYTLNKVSQVISDVDFWQFRAPTGIGVYLIPYLSLFTKKKGWYKYAGNWVQSNPPFGYRLQRFFLKLQKRKVTVNGKWENDNLNKILAFENPCLSKDDIEEGRLSLKKGFKQNNKIVFCFIGRLETNKGVERIIKAFGEIKTQFKYQVHFVGDGPCELSIESSKNSNFIIHGFQNKDYVKHILKQSDFLLLPSDSEGFPKVVAESMCYGCVPIVTDVSSISQYVNTKNGFLLNHHNITNHLTDCIRKILVSNPEKFDNFKILGHEVSKKFTFERYTYRLLNEILN